MVDMMMFLGLWYCLQVHLHNACHRGTHGLSACSPSSPLHSIDNESKIDGTPRKWFISIECRFATAPTPDLIRNFFYEEIKKTRFVQYTLSLGPWHCSSSACISIYYMLCPSFPIKCISHDAFVIFRVALYLLLRSRVCNIDLELNFNTWQTASTSGFSASPGSNEFASAMSEHVEHRTTLARWLCVCVWQTPSLFVGSRI